MNAYPQEFKSLSPKIVLGIAAHPDDLDFGASGTLAAFAAGTSLQAQDNAAPAKKPGQTEEPAKKDAKKGGKNRVGMPSKVSPPNNCARQRRTGRAFLPSYPRP